MLFLAPCKTVRDLLQSQGNLFIRVCYRQPRKWDGTFFFLGKVTTGRGSSQWLGMHQESVLDLLVAAGLPCVVAKKNHSLDRARVALPQGWCLSCFVDPARSWLDHDPWRETMFTYSVWLRGHNVYYNFMKEHANHIIFLLSCIIDEKVKVEQSIFFFNCELMYFCAHSFLMGRGVGELGWKWTVFILKKTNIGNYGPIKRLNESYYESITSGCLLQQKMNPSQADTLYAKSDLRQVQA